MFIIPWFIIVILRVHHTVPSFISRPIGLLAILEGTAYTIIALMYAYMLFMTWRQVRR